MTTSLNAWSSPCNALRRPEQDEVALRHLAARIWHLEMYAIWVRRQVPTAPTMNVVNFDDFEPCLKEKACNLPHQWLTKALFEEGAFDLQCDAIIEE